MAGDRRLDLGAARSARAEARGEQPVFEVDETRRWYLPSELRQSHIERFQEVSELDGLVALVRDGASEAGEDPDAAEESFRAEDWPLADQMDISDWMEETVYPELAEAEKRGNEMQAASRRPKQPAKRSKAAGKR